MTSKTTCPISRPEFTHCN